MSYLEEAKQKIAKVKSIEKKIPIIKLKSSVLERLKQLEKKNEKIKNKDSIPRASPK
jgi:hypothetical protein